MVEVISVFMSVALVVIQTTKYVVRAEDPPRKQIDMRVTPNQARRI